MSSDNLEIHSDFDLATSFPCNATGVAMNIRHTVRMDNTRNKDGSGYIGGDVGPLTQSHGYS